MGAKPPPESVKIYDFHGFLFPKGCWLLTPPPGQIPEYAPEYPTYKFEGGVPGSNIPNRYRPRFTGQSTHFVPGQENYQISIIYFIL